MVVGEVEEVRERERDDGLIQEAVKAQSQRRKSKSSYSAALRFVVRDATRSPAEFTLRCCCSQRRTEESLSVGRVNKTAAYAHNSIISRHVQLIEKSSFVIFFVFALYERLGQRDAQRHVLRL